MIFLILALSLPMSVALAAALTIVLLTTVAARGPLSQPVQRFHSDMDQLDADSTTIRTQESPKE